MPANMQSRGNLMVKHAGRADSFDSIAQRWPFWSYSLFYISIYSQVAALKCEGDLKWAAQVHANTTRLSLWQKDTDMLLCRYWSTGTAKLGQFWSQTAARISRHKLLTCDQSLLSHIGWQESSTEREILKMFLTNPHVAKDLFLEIRFSS